VYGPNKVSTEIRACTAEQLTGLNAMKDAGVDFYVNFASWGPYGSRLLRKVKMTATLPQPDGSYKQVELFGPPDVASWKLCADVLETGIIYTDLMDYGTWVEYSNMIEAFALTYGPDAWGFLYQQEVRARRERSVFHRQRGVREKAAADTAGTAHAFDPARPYEWVYQAILRDQPWWNREFEHKAVLLAAHIASKASAMGSDALTAGHGSHITEAAAIFTLASERARESRRDTGREREPPAPKRRPGGPTSNARNAHNVRTDEGGVVRHVTNRREKPLCQGFQKNQCPDDADVAKRPWCPVNWGQMHQCDKCLQTGHGGDSCGGVPRERNTARPKGKGNGGKGGKGGKAGRR
jgi:hypothetical protein